jgi:hypothetical protein
MCNSTSVLAPLATLWIHGGLIPPCPCSAPTEDQVRRPIGGDQAEWFCLVCQRGRDIESGWSDLLVPISLEEWQARSRVMAARVRARWCATGQ